MIDAASGAGGVTGFEKIKVEMSLDDVTFVIAGLRDNATSAEKRLATAVGGDVHMELDLVRANQRIASMLEAAYANQLGNA